MAKTYTSSVQIKCRKQHTCSGCGGAYSYILARKATGSGGSAERARVNMEKRIATIMSSETDMQPCPTCGLYQADMIGQKRARSRIQFFWIALIVLATVLILRATDAVQTETLTYIVGGVLGFVAIAHLLLELLNVNSNLQSNLALAQQRVAEGKIQFTPGKVTSRSADFARPARPMMHNLALLLLLVSIVAMFLPTLARRVHHWPINSDCYPPVVGATDHTRVYLHDTITSIKGFWRGSPTVVMTVAGQASPITLPSTTDQKDWGQTIYAKSDEESNRSHPWVQFEMPAEPDLAGKTANTEVNLKIDYPQKTSGSSFETVQATLSERYAIDLAPAHAGELYNSLWWAGTTGGGGLVVVMSLVLYRLAKKSRKLAEPTTTFPLVPAVPQV